MKKNLFLFIFVNLFAVIQLFSQNQILLSEKETAKLLNSPKLLDTSNKKIYIHEMYRFNDYSVPEEKKGFYFVFFTPPELIDKSTKEKITSSLVYVENKDGNEIVDIMKNRTGDSFVPYYESQSKYGNEYIKFDSKGHSFISVAQYSTREYGVLMFSPENRFKKFFPLPHPGYKIFDFEISDDGKYLVIQSQNDDNNWRPRNIYIYDTESSEPPEQFFEHDISNTSLIHFRAKDQCFCFFSFYDLEPELCGFNVIKNRDGKYSKSSADFYSASECINKDFNFENPLLYIDKQNERLYSASYLNYSAESESVIYELSYANGRIDLSIPFNLREIKVHGTQNERHDFLLGQSPLGIRLNSSDKKIYTLCNEQLQKYQNEEEYNSALKTVLLQNGRTGSSITLLKIEYKRNLTELRIILILVTVAMIVFILLFIKEKNHKNMKLEQELILQIQEEEKAKISREIHDTVVQDLRAIRVQAETIKTSDISLQERLVEDITNCIVKMRNICYNLTPAELATHSEGDDSKIELISIIDTLCRQFYEKTKIPCSIQIEENLVFPVFEKEVSTNIIRVFQEILTNIEKHSYATNTSVLIRSKIEKEKKYLVIFVIDDGIGCDLEKLKRMNKKNHFGMQNMKDRMKQIGSQIEFFSMPNEGMKIKLTILMEE